MVHQLVPCPRTVPPCSHHTGPKTGAIFPLRYEKRCLSCDAPPLLRHCSIGCFGPASSVSAAKVLYTGCGSGGTTYSGCSSRGYATNYPLFCPIYENFTDNLVSLAAVLGVSTPQFPTLAPTVGRWIILFPQLTAQTQKLPWPVRRQRRRRRFLQGPRRHLRSLSPPRAPPPPLRRRQSLKWRRRRRRSPLEHPRPRRQRAPRHRPRPLRQLMARLRRLHRVAMPMLVQHLQASLPARLSALSSALQFSPSLSSHPTGCGFPAELRRTGQPRILLTLLGTLSRLCTTRIGRRRQRGRLSST